MATFHIVLTDEEYTKLRMAGMRGDFDHEISRDNKNNVRIKTRNPKLLVSELEALIDSGETSWNEILDIKG